MILFDNKFMPITLPDSEYVNATLLQMQQRYRLTSELTSFAVIPIVGNTPE
jgi:hypothetical protein